MSDSTFSGKPMSTEAISLDELKQYADAHRDGRPVLRPDALNDFEAQAKLVIEQANLSSHARMMALPKLAELMFWIRAGLDRG